MQKQVHGSYYSHALPRPSQQPRLLSWSMHLASAYSRRHRCALASRVMHRAISSVSSRGNGVAAAQLPATGRWSCWKKGQGDVRSHRKREHVDGGRCSPSSRISEGLLVQIIVRFLNGLSSFVALNQQKSSAMGVAPNPPCSRGAVSLA